MNKKGFTLVELLAVIGVLSLILVFAIPAVFSSRDNIISGISAQEKKNIIEAGKMFAIDLDDYTSDVFNCKSTSWAKNKCTKSSGRWTKAVVKLSELKSHDYFEDTNDHCTDGNITIIKTESGYDVTIESKIKCN